MRLTVKAENVETALEYARHCGISATTYGMGWGFYRAYLTCADTEENFRLVHKWYCKPVTRNELGSPFGTLLYFDAERAG